MNNKQKKAKLVYGDGDKPIQDDGANDDLPSPVVTSIEVPELVSAMDSTIKAKLRDKIKKLGAEKEELKLTCEVRYE